MTCENKDVRISLQQGAIRENFSIKEWLIMEQKKAFVEFEASQKTTVKAIMTISFNKKLLKN